MQLDPGRYAPADDDSVDPQPTAEPGSGRGDWWLPSQRPAEEDLDRTFEYSRAPAPEAAPKPKAAPEPRRTLENDPIIGSTVVLPYLGSSVARKTRPLRVWMLSLPVDFVAFALPAAHFQNHWKSIVAAAALTVALFAAGGLYGARRHLSFLDDLPTLIGRMLVAGAMVSIVVAIRHESADNLSSYLRVVAVSAVVVLLGRALNYFLVRLARRRRWVEHSAIILGGGPVAIELARLLRRYPQYGLRFAGFVDVETTAHELKESTPLIGRFDDLDQVARMVDCDVIVIADIDLPESRLLPVVRSAETAQYDLWMVPRLREFSSGSSSPDHIGAIPVVRVRRPTITGLRWFVKRASDVVLSGIALLLLSPLLLLTAIAVRLEGGKGIFFKQQRIGQFGKPFELIKFRSMRPVNEAESQTNWNIAHDKRVGPVGKFIRRTSLDELPQLWNIMRGDMTIVGPRPERPYFVDQFSAEHPDYAMRHRAPVGLTGLAQVSGLRGDTPISDRARFDNYYIENWSLWLDVKVVLRTVAEVFRGGGR
ncbi:sugar transferase [Dactylosporangium sp. AC04546]|uniref:sugar transferase n=1 Tax=Dactylosporangium sp. AC04546 TaxID=2862460 RepID=UPI001EE0A171|nr:sugar transferase [Dactylosporangium sp. AC04546]WVK81428.1 sugar transferase [Dactylosporangium sp. AC04546]